VAVSVGAIKSKEGENFVANMLGGERVFKKKAKKIGVIIRAKGVGGEKKRKNEKWVYAESGSGLVSKLGPVSLGGVL